MAIGGGRSLSDMLRPNPRLHLADQFMQALLVAIVEWIPGHELAILSVGQATTGHRKALDVRGLGQGGRGSPCRVAAALRIQEHPVGR